MNKTKMMKTAKHLDTFFKVVQRILVIAMIVALGITTILTVMKIVNPDAVIGENFEAIDIGPVTIELTQEYAPEEKEVLAYAWICIALAAVFTAVICYAIQQIRKILKPMTEGNPFHQDISGNIRKIAFVSIAVGVIENIAYAIETSYIIQQITGMEEFETGRQIVSIMSNYTVDLSFLLVFAFLMLISYIFKYGTELQQLSDETL